MIATQLQPTSIHHNMGRITPGWDDQIVPTLRKRLESESKFLTKRLSATSSEEPSPPPSSKLNSFPQSPTFGVFPPPKPKQNPYPTAAGSSSTANVIRSRTKSGPYLNDTRQFGNDNYRGRQSLGKEEEVGDNLGIRETAAIRNTPPRINTSIPSSSSSSSSPRINPTSLPSRIPTRPRSKSQLSSISRPPPVHTNSHPPPPPLPSTGTGIPILKTRSRSPSKRSVTTPKMSVAVVEPRRESLELGGSRIKEGFIKNELPPFKMNPNEAMRIAEKGHELHNQDWDGVGIGSSSNNRANYDNPSNPMMNDRKRSISMKPNNNGSPNTRNLHPRSNHGHGHGMERSGSSGSDRSSTRRHSRPSTSSATMASSTRGYGISTSHTGLGLGMGQPPSTSSRYTNNGKPTQNQRSGSSRSPVNGSPSISSFNAPRSASLNLLSGNGSPSMNGTPPNSRLGVAAHFIPPESNYTPPKGTDWDDVVLPTVAKKLGINENEKKESINGLNAGNEDEDLAVEWDKDGTPIRWVKRKGNGAKIGLGLGGSTGIQNSQQSSETTPTRTHAFSPTFEPSPDNPLQPRQKASSSSLRHKPSSDVLELAPLRTTNGQPVSLGQPVDSRSNTSNAYYPGGEPFPRQNSAGSRNGIHRKTSSQNISPSTGFPSGSNPELKRKPSTLKKQNQNTPSVSRQGSELSLRNRNLSNVSRNQNNGVVTSFGQVNPSTTPTPGTTHRITDAIYENQLARREGRMNEKNQNQSRVAKSQQGKGKDDGIHGPSKGCGCLIM